MSKYIGVYTDRKLSTELPMILVDGKLVPLLKLGNLNVGKDLRFPLYLENKSSGTIEDLRIDMNPVNRKGISIKVENGKIPPLKMGAVHEVIISWVWGEDVRAGPFKAVLSIKGVVTEELV